VHLDAWRGELRLPAHLVPDSAALPPRAADLKVSARSAEHADVAGLPATAGKERRTGQQHPGAVAVDIENLRVERRQVGIDGEQLARHQVGGGVRRDRSAARNGHAAILPSVPWHTGRVSPIRKASCVVS